VIYDRLHTREIARYGGLAINMPCYAALFMLFTMASVGLPGTSNFVGEFLALAGTYKVSTWVALIAAPRASSWAPAYMLYLYRRVVFGDLVKDDVRRDARPFRRELWLLAPIAAAVLWMGVYPESFLASRCGPMSGAGRAVEPAAPAGDSQADAGKPAPSRASWRSSMLPNIHAAGGRTDETIPCNCRHARAGADAGRLILLMLVAAWGGQGDPAGQLRCRSRCWPARASRSPVRLRMGGDAFGGLYRADACSRFRQGADLWSRPAVSILIAPRFFIVPRATLRAEYPMLILLSRRRHGHDGVGGRHVDLYVGLELQSLAAYVLASFMRRDERVRPKRA
jgi:hypothetical protein